MNLTHAEFEFLQRHDLMTFIERSFYELNPQATFSASPHIEVLASRLEACRQGRIRRLIVNQPPRSLNPMPLAWRIPLGFSGTIQLSRSFVPATDRLWPINMPATVVS